MKSSYLIALVIALAAAGWLASPYLAGSPAGEAENVRAPVQPVRATKAAMRVQVRNSVAETRVNSLVLTGQTEPSRQPPSRRKPRRALSP